MASKKLAVSDEAIDNLILEIRTQRVIVDSDLAALYDVTTKRLNEQFRRNRRRFPDDFAFQLTAQETNNLRSQFATSRTDHGGRRYRPYAFTEHGALQAANILNSLRAVQMSVFVIRAFVRMRGLLGDKRAHLRSMPFSTFAAMIANV